MGAIFLCHSIPRSSGKCCCRWCLGTDSLIDNLHRSSLHWMCGLGMGICIFFVMDERRNRRMASSSASMFTMAQLMGMFYSVAEMNPTRSFTPVMFKRNFMNHWVY
ncbi:lens fiber major intrinsic protein-like [Engraulis encrasicolus]|uniref:lens fiber major intrinsic protein-like n=1 Tax=Engraulis encrasicolus TaxID=184585 RepID=UPI002FD3E959